MGRLFDNLRRISAALLLASTAIYAGGCTTSIAEEDLEDFDTPKVEVFFNSTGTRPGNQYDLKPSEYLIERMDGVRNTLDVAAYGFDKPNIVRGIVQAYNRGIDVRFVGSTSHLDEDGYQRLRERHIPMQVGNEFHIMHNKFFILDERFVFVGTGNITPTGFQRNNNNWVWFESAPLAKDFGEEFEQMFDGRFSTAKESTNDVNTYEIGDTTVEVYFSPQEKAMTRMIEEINKVHTSLHFQIFAFTKNEVGSAMIRKHRELMAHNEKNADKNWRKKSPRKWPKKVTGLLDRSQVHGNGQYHEAYRLSAFGIPMKMDANERAIQPGDYQAGGGRLHTKTMMLDAGTEDARVITGSFNWSSSATIANDEVMMILRGERITERYMSMFDALWLKSRKLPAGLCNYLTTKQKDENMMCSDEVEPKDIVFSEVHWDGWNGESDPSAHTGPPSERRRIVNDEFIELYNTTNRPIDMSMWSITNGDDFVVGFPPGTIIQPKQYYLVLDHNTITYSERRPQRGEHAFQNADFVLNTANDPRFPRLNLKNSALRLELRKVGSTPKDPAIDVVGDGGPPYAGGRDVECTSDCQSFEPVYEVKKNYSMERKIPTSKKVEIPDGDKKSSWTECKAKTGGKNVNKRFREFIIATPGQPNANSK